jgi:TPR repeat protein
MEKAMTNPNVSKLENNKSYKKALERHALGDDIEALRLFTGLSEEGHMLAQHRLAKIHLDEHSGDEDALSEAVRLFKLAAKQGYLDSAFNLGTLYESGQHIKKSVTDAYYWYCIAARADDVESQEILDSIDSLVFSEDDNSYEFSYNDSYYSDEISAVNDLCRYMDEAAIKELLKALQKKWPNEYGLVVQPAKKQKKT